MTTKPALSPDAREALMACFATRGKRKGRLMATCPSAFKAPMAHAAWQGAMLACNPFKASIGALMFMDTEQRAVANEVTAYFEARPALRRVADFDRDQLEALGVW